MHNSQIVGPVGLKAKYIEFCKGTRNRKIKLASETIEKSLCAGPKGEAIDPDTELVCHGQPGRVTTQESRSCGTKKHTQLLKDASKGKTDLSSLSKPTGPAVGSPPGVFLAHPNECGGSPEMVDAY